MGNSTRMSPLTAFFIGLFFLGGLIVSAITVVTLRGMNMFDRNVALVIELAEGTLENLPEALENASPLISRFVGERNLEYAGNIGVTVQLSPRPGGKTLRPALQVVNKGSLPINLLTIRVAALTAQNVPISEWTEVVATPIGIENDWRGPLAPGQTRYVVLRRGWELPEEYATTVTLAYEVVEVFVPNADASGGTSNRGTGKPLGVEKHAAIGRYPKAD
jgi:hypothetical protein